MIGFPYTIFPFQNGYRVEPGSGRYHGGTSCFGVSAGTTQVLWQSRLASQLWFNSSLKLLNVIMKLKLLNDILLREKTVA